MKKRALETENTKPQIHPNANDLDLAGIVYNSDCKLTTQAENWSFGRTDRIIVEGDHDVSITRSKHTIFLFEDGENERGEGSMDGKPVYRRGPLRGKIDLIPKMQSLKQLILGQRYALPPSAFPTS